MADTALLIIDLQNDYFPGGRMELEGAAAAAANAARMLNQFRARNLPVIHVRHLSVRPGASFFLPVTSYSLGFGTYSTPAPYSCLKNSIASSRFIR